MRKLSFPALPVILAAALVLSLSLPASANEQYEKLLDQGLRTSEPYAYSLIEQAEGSGDRAALIREALQASPDLPLVYFKLSWAVLPNVFEGLQTWTAGIKAYTRNFWWSFSLAALLFTGTIFSFALAAAVVVLMRLPMQLKFLAHDINENKAKVIIPFVLIPLAFGGPVLFFAGALVIAGLYFRRSGKVVVYVALLGVLFSPYLLKQVGTFHSAAASTDLKAIAAVNEGRDNSYALTVLGGSSSAQARFSYALALKRVGRYQEAISLYSELASVDSPAWEALNNLGNAYTATNRFDLAKEAYSKAYKIKPTAIALYNLSQVYRGTLNYEKGDKYYADASALDRDLVSRFTALASENPNRFVIDEVYPVSRLWDFALRISGDGLYPYPVPPAVVAAMAVFLLVLFAALDVLMKSRAFRCSRCGRVACDKCGKSQHLGQTMCGQCHSDLARGKDANRAARVTELLAAHEKKNRQRARTRLISFAPPGIVQLYVGNVLGGMVLLWVFLFAGVTIWLNPFISTGLMGMAHGWLPPPLVALMVILYVASTFSINRRLESGWL